MRRPVLDSGEAKVIVYASRAGENITAMDIIKACDNRIRHMRHVLQQQGKTVTKVFKLANNFGDIEITARWIVYGAKRNKHERRRRATINTNAGPAAPEQVLGRAETPEGLQENPGDNLGEGYTGESPGDGPPVL